MRCRRPETQKCVRSAPNQGCDGWQVQEDHFPLELDLKLLTWLQIVGDHFEFRGRGNESSGDPFPAAPNLDHSAEFVKRDLSDWLRWMRSDYGFDGWR